MTAHDGLSAHPTAFQLSRRRASARNTEVRLNSDVGSHDAHLKIGNWSAFRPETRDRAPRADPHMRLQRTTGHLPHIEIP
jgi:hypothetical protein